MIAIRFGLAPFLLALTVNWVSAQTQSTSGDCSPNISGTNRDVTIICPTKDQDPLDGSGLTTATGARTLPFQVDGKIVKPQRAVVKFVHTGGCVRFTMTHNDGYVYFGTADDPGATIKGKSARSAWGGSSPRKLEKYLPAGEHLAVVAVEFGDSSTYVLGVSTAASC